MLFFFVFKLSAAEAVTSVRIDPRLLLVKKDQLWSKRKPKPKSFTLSQTHTYHRRKAAWRHMLVFDWMTHALCLAQSRVLDLYTVFPESDQLTKKGKKHRVAYYLDWIAVRMHSPCYKGSGLNLKTNVWWFLCVYNFFLVPFLGVPKCHLYIFTRDKKKWVTVTGCVSKDKKKMQQLCNVFTSLD